MLHILHSQAFQNPPNTQFRSGVRCNDRLTLVAAAMEEGGLAEAMEEGGLAEAMGEGGLAGAMGEGGCMGVEQTSWPISAKHPDQRIGSMMKHAKPHGSASLSWSQCRDICSAILACINPGYHLDYQVVTSLDLPWRRRRGRRRRGRRWGRGAWRRRWRRRVWWRRRRRAAEGVRHRGISRVRNDGPQVPQQCMIWKHEASAPYLSAVVFSKFTYIPERWRWRRTRKRQWRRRTAKGRGSA